MSAQIKYAYLKDRTWLYRRNFPRDVALVIGQQAMKQSLKTGDVQTARVRAAQLNAEYETLVVKVREGTQEVLSLPNGGQPDAQWQRDSEAALAHLRDTLGRSGGLSVSNSFARATKKPAPTVGKLGEQYLRKRSRELRPGGFKSVRYSVELFLSKYGHRDIRSMTRQDGKEFLGLISNLSPYVGKSELTRGLGLEQAIEFSTRSNFRIKARTQKRIWEQVSRFMDWAVYEGHLEQNPFKTVLFGQKVKQSPYAVLTDEEVKVLLGTRDRVLAPVMLTCLLTGMRAGEATGLLREDLVYKGKLGLFFHVRPNHLRDLKTDAANRLIPVHPHLVRVIDALPSAGPLFPDLKVDHLTKRFARVREKLDLARPGLVFHSTRKWFITQCERSGVPEHFTASLVGHKSARSENGITYGIYSAGISDEQKRGIVDQIRLPVS